MTSSERRKLQWQDPAYRKMMSDAHKGNPKNPGAYSWTSENCPQVISQEFRDKLSRERIRSGNPRWNGGEQNEDRLDNRIDNLMLFKCSGDHIRHHHNLRRAGGAI